MHEGWRFDSRFCHLDTLFVLDLAFAVRAIGEDGLTEVRHGKNGIHALRDGSQQPRNKIGEETSPLNLYVEDLAKHFSSSKLAVTISLPWDVKASTLSLLNVAGDATDLLWALFEQYFHDTATLHAGRAEDGYCFGHSSF